jgi:hypothetical protein
MMGFKVISFIGGKARSKESLGRTRRRWVDNIKLDLGEIGWMWYELDGSGSR